MGGTVRGVSWSQVKYAISLAGSVSLAFADTWWTPLGGS